MNFKEWYNSKDGNKALNRHYQDEYDKITFEAWKACKKEVLTIIKNSNPSMGQDAEDVLCLLVDKIKNL